MGLVWAISTMFFVLQLPNLKFSLEFESLFASADSDVVFYQQHRHYFSGSDDYLTIILENRTGVFDSLFFEKVATADSKIKSLEGVRSVQSPLNLQFPGTSESDAPVIRVLQPQKYEADSIAVFSHPIFCDFFGFDGESLLLQVHHRHFTDAQASSELSRSITNILQEGNFDKFRIVGKLTAREALLNYTKNHLLPIVVVTFLAGFILLVVAFRSAKVALLPLFVFVTSSIWMLGWMALTGYILTIFSVGVVALTFFYTYSNSIFLLSQFYNDPKGKGIRRFHPTSDKPLYSILISSVFIAFGIGASLLFNSPPVRQSGVFMAIAVFITLLVSVGVFPFFVPNRKIPSVKLISIGWITDLLSSQSHIFSLFVFASLLAISSLFYLKTDTSLLDNLPVASEVRDDFEFVDIYYEGSKSWELAYWPTDTGATIWDEDVMLESDKIHQYLTQEYPIKRLLSPVSFVRFGNQIGQRRNDDFYDFPHKANYEKARLRITSMMHSEVFPKLCSEDGRYARFNGFIPENGSYDMMRRNAALSAFLAQQIDHKLLSYRLTGMTYLIDTLDKEFTIDLITSILAGILVLSILQGIYFKSFKVFVISTIAIIIPLLFVAACMGLMGISLQLTTAIVLVTIFGIQGGQVAYFISSFQRNRATNWADRIGVTFQQAMPSATLSSGVALVSFGLFIPSGFQAIHHLGLISVIGLMFMLVTNFVLLPLLLAKFAKEKECH